MSKYKVLLTDYAWPDLEIERRILAEVDAELVVADSQDVPSLIHLAADVDAIITCWAKVPKEVIAAAARCQIVARLGIGLDNIDVANCTERGIPVTNVPDYCVDEVAEHALALILSLARKVSFFHHETKNGRYDLQAGPQMHRLNKQTLGIVGLGNIGRRLAEKATALGLRVIATSRSCDKAPPGVEFCELNELLAHSDFVSLHVPLTPETRHIINAEALAGMKPTAYLINTARGGLIDHTAIAEALTQNRIAGAALDVQDPEPPDLSQAPFNDPRVIITPHAAFVSVESLEELRTRTAKQVVTRLMQKVPEHVVNPAVLSRA